MSAPTAPGGTNAPRSPRFGLRGIAQGLRTRALLSGVLCVAVIVVIASAEPGSVTGPQSGLLFGGVLPLLFAAYGQMFIILAGDIDISVGAAMGLVNVLTATVLVSSPIGGVLALIGVVVGYVAMGVVVHVTRVPAIVITLGASFIWLGIAITIQSVPGGSSPGWLSSIMSLQTPLVPLPVYIIVVSAALVYWLLFRTKYGVVMRGFGRAPAALKVTGRSALICKALTYMAAGICVCLSGLMLTATNYGSDANGSSTYTLVSIAAVIIGGAEFIGGVVAPVGVAFGAVTLSLVSSLLAFVGVASSYEAAVQGLILIATLTFRQFSSRRRREAFLW